jgi:hypothetical protein
MQPIQVTVTPRVGNKFPAEVKRVVDFGGAREIEARIEYEYFPGKAAWCWLPVSMLEPALDWVSLAESK